MSKAIHLHLAPTSEVEDPTTTVILDHVIRFSSAWNNSDQTNVWLSDGRVITAQISAAALTDLLVDHKCLEDVIFAKRSG